MLVLASPLVYAALQNDVFSELIPPMDDLGFTHDNVLAIGVERDDYIFGGRIFDRWITSRTDRRRWDQLDLFATVEARFAPYLQAQARLGPTFGGNYGGQYIQNGWHSLSGTVPTVEQGLANDYAGDRTYGVLAGVHLHGELGTSYSRGPMPAPSAMGSSSSMYSSAAMTSSTAMSSSRPQASAYANLDGQG